jgi:hypothetical protein
MAQSAFATTVLEAIANNIKTNTDILNSLSGLTIHLFCQPLSPDSSTALATYTNAESVDSGYSPISASSGTSVVGLNSTGQYEAIITSPSISYTFNNTTSGGATVYGWWAQQSGNLIYAKTFDTPIPITVDGQVLVFVPRVSLSNDAGGN